MKDSELEANHDLQRPPRPQDSPNWNQGRGPGRDPANDRRAMARLFTGSPLFWAIVIGLAASAIGRCS
jgi:hypothetical protein